MSLEFLRIKGVMDRTGLARSTIHLYKKQGRFPAPIPIGSSRAVGWIASEVDEWMQAQVRAVRGPDGESARPTSTAA